MTLSRKLFMFTLVFLGLYTSVFSQQRNVSSEEYLSKEAKQIGYQDSDLSGLILTDSYTSNGITHDYFVQSIENIPIYQAFGSVHKTNEHSFTSQLGFLHGLSNIKTNNSIN